jgi:peptidoglycan/LPS O-acetylase OafA/YrhL
MRRSRAVDALRAVAVLLVMLHHLPIGPLVNRSPWLAWLRDLHAAGFVGVSLFLVLSGFSIHLRVAAGAPFRTRAFLLRRLVRLHPTYYVAMCFAGAVAWVSAAAGHPWTQPQWGFSSAPVPVPVLVVVHLTVVAGTLIPPGWLMVTWSLALEEQIYLVYAAAVGWMRRTRPVAWVLCALALCLVFRVGSELVLPSVPKSFGPLAAQSSWVSALAFQQAPARLAEWLLGALAAEWYVGNQRLPRLLTARVTAAAALAGLWWLFGHRGGYGTLAGHPFSATDLVFDPACGLAFFVLLCACLAAERRRGDAGRTDAGRTGARRTDAGRTDAGRRDPERGYAWPRRRLPAFGGGLAWLGERSYSLYLVHAPIVGTTFALAGGLLQPAAGRLAVAAVAVALSVGCAAVLYRCVEAPCTAWSKRVGRPRTTTPVSGDARVLVAAAPETRARPELNAAPATRTGREVSAVR